MIIKAKQKYIRMSPRKLRLVADTIRNLEPHEALDQLAFMRKIAAKEIAKTIKQALANAVNNLNIDKDNLKFKSIDIEEGPTYKRWRAVSRGRAHSIMKRTSHISVLLEAIEQKESTKEKKSVAEKNRKVK